MARGKLLVPNPGELSGCFKTDSPYQRSKARPTKERLAPLTCQQPQHDRFTNPENRALIVLEDRDVEVIPAPLYRQDRIESILQWLPI